MYTPKTMKAKLRRSDRIGERLQEIKTSLKTSLYNSICDGHRARTVHGVYVSTAAAADDDFSYGGSISSALYSVDNQSMSSDDFNYNYSLRSDSFPTRGSSSQASFSFKPDDDDTIITFDFDYSNCAMSTSRHAQLDYKSQTLRMDSISSSSIKADKSSRDCIPCPPRQSTRKVSWKDDHITKDVKEVGDTIVVTTSCQQLGQTLHSNDKLYEVMALNSTCSTDYLSSGDNIDDLSDINVNSSLSSTAAIPQTPKFSDYVDAGLDIDLCVAIDFTSSNGDPRIPGTLHYSRDGMTNDYEDALQFIGSKVETYSKSKEFPVFGFGAKFDGQVRHIFQCGQTPTATGIQGVLAAYRSVFQSDVTLSGPTVLLSVLKAAAARANKIHKGSPSSEQLKLKYSVILILTDGVVNDLQSTREFVLKCQRLRLPLSVIVVGIGRADFTAMSEWSKKQSDLRGCFTFVEFRTLQFDPEALARKALERLPQEVVDYFSRR